MNGDSTWNRELIHRLVDDNTGNRIFSIPISESRPEDMLVWKYEGSEEYTVKSEYRVLITEFLQSNFHTSSNDEDYKGFYTDLWAFNIPEKIKIYVWRMFNNLVPYYGNLVRRTLCEETVCPLCKVELEKSEHLLWSCEVLQGVKFSMPKLLGFIRGYEQDLCLVHENLCHFPISMGKELWRPPDYGIIKLNFDASFIQGKKLATTTVLARGYKGEIVGAETYLFEDVGDAFVAEARACERVLIFVRQMCFRRLIVEGDSLSIIKNIKKNEEDKSVLRPITYHIHQLNLLFDEVTYSFVPRAVNDAAHVLALEGFFESPVLFSKRRFLLLHIIVTDIEESSSG
ncbi:hypothetical protein Goari_016519 [Gossypium aridum]|uniref:Reverse transcriptase n=1 Tax=Gossypium aridum TaxID=34290 RepID=A0A7J8WJB5_GOSAI|nr:hypothetical protein [Gossypium aridum]